jgi:ribosome-associated protein
MQAVSSQALMPTIAADEVEITAVRAQGAGGQNVNKVSTAIHLRFDIGASSLPDACKGRLLSLHDQRISNDGIVVIKAQRYRSQDKNRDDALQRLQTLVDSVAVPKVERKPTQPTRASERRRREQKIRRGQAKALRGKVREVGDA